MTCAARAATVCLQPRILVRMLARTAPLLSQWASAVALYTECLALDPAHAAFNSKLFANRAAAHMK